LKCAEGEVDGSLVSRRPPGRVVNQPEGDGEEKDR
jgi:hypothetical protein